MISTITGISLRLARVRHRISHPGTLRSALGLPLFAAGDHTVPTTSSTTSLVPRMICALYPPRHGAPACVTRRWRALAFVTYELTKFAPLTRLQKSCARWAQRTTDVVSSLTSAACRRGFELHTHKVRERGTMTLTRNRLAKFFRRVSPELHYLTLLTTYLRLDAVSRARK
ncbi:hypothetical protein SCHPADRAFT_756856 [Schizopora paradoxa]|uniref:Uncharacterized protein n=1 Tax=Schizopora paradoxa TaxID=27342 RepID=A0A0H2QXG5_9AGAM|nr:hypothetical protein SCHPADRAFT_756856 [Schizopora paradoxa]